MSADAERYVDTEAGCGVSVEVSAGFAFLYWDDPAAPPEADGFDGADEAMWPAGDFEEQVGDRFVEPGDA